jgi:hypothetical protein
MKGEKIFTFFLAALFFVPLWGKRAGAGDDCYYTPFFLLNLANIMHSRPPSHILVV